MAPTILARLGILVLATATLGWLPPAATLAQEGGSDFRPRRVLAPLPTITKIPIKSNREAAQLLGPSELVLGVVVGKEARAYPINMLTGPQREILNDTLGGVAIAATW